MDGASGFIFKRINRQCHCHSVMTMLRRLMHLEHFSPQHGFRVYGVGAGPAIYEGQFEQKARPAAVHRRFVVSLFFYRCLSWLSLVHSVVSCLTRPSARLPRRHMFPCTSDCSLRFPSLQQFDCGLIDGISLTAWVSSTNSYGRLIDVTCLASVGELEGAVLSPEIREELLRLMRLSRLSGSLCGCALQVCSHSVLPTFSPFLYILHIFLTIQSPQFFVYSCGKCFFPHLRT